MIRGLKWVDRVLRWLDPGIVDETENPGIVAGCDLSAWPPGIRAKVAADFARREDECEPEFIRGPAKYNRST